MKQQSTPKFRYGIPAGLRRNCSACVEGLSLSCFVLIFSSCSSKDLKPGFTVEQKREPVTEVLNTDLVSEPEASTFEDHAVVLILNTDFGPAAAEGTCKSSYLSYQSANPELVASANAISWGGVWPNCTATIKPATNATGDASVIITAKLGNQERTQTIKLSILPVNDAPTISAISSQIGYAGEQIEIDSLVIGDSDSELDCAVSLSAASSNTAIVADQTFKFSGIYPKCSLSFTSAADVSGSTDITVTATDGELTDEAIFSFETQKLPTLSSVSPSSALKAGGGVLTVKGTGFVENTTVTVGGATCSSLVVKSSTEIACTIPIGTVGVQDVVIDGPWNSPVTLEKAFTYR